MRISRRSLLCALSVLLLLLTLAFLGGCQSKDDSILPMLPATDALRYASNGDGTCTVTQLLPRFSKGSVMIPSLSPDGETVVAIAEKALAGNRAIKELYIPTTVKKIEASAFANCPNLALVVMDDGVEEIGKEAFTGCTALVNVRFSEKLTLIGANAFRDCTALIVLQLPESLEEIKAGAFYGCRKLQDVHLGTRIKCIGSAVFSNCYITNVFIRDMAAFLNIDFVESYSNPIFRQSNLTINTPTLYCNNEPVYELTIPKEITELKSYALHGYANLRQLILPSGFTTLCDRALYNCVNLKSIYISETVTSIGSQVFDGCYLDMVSIADLSAYCALEYTDALLSHSKAFAVNGAPLKGELVIPDGVTGIGNHCFNGCAGITAVTLPNSVQYIDSYAFMECANLVTVTLPAGLKKLGSFAFANCVSLSDITLPDTLQTMEDSVFWNCDALTECTIPGNIKNVGSKLFWGCDSLTAITLAEGVETLEEYALAGCNALTNITLPSTLRAVKECAFYHCVSLVDVTFVYIYQISDAAFRECASLNTIRLPDTIRKYGNDTFTPCPDGSQGLCFSRSIDRKVAELQFSVPIYYYSEEEPPEGELAWHYVNNRMTLW